MKRNTFEDLKLIERNWLLGFIAMGNNILSYIMFSIIIPKNNLKVPIEHVTYALFIIQV